MSDPQGDLPLDDLRVIDLSGLTPGPYASMMLAELGATVIKVERPGSGDPLREMLPNSFKLLNRGKLSAALDLKDEGDREILLALCKHAHVFIEGFRPGVAERLGVGFPQVSARAEGIIYLSLSSYGQGGPLAEVPGHDLNFVARAGGMALSGLDDGRSRYDGTYQIADLAMSAFAVVGVLAAALRRPRRAVHIDLSLLGSALAFTQLPAAEASDVHGHGEAAGPRPEQRAANGVFFAGDRLPLTVCAVEDHFWLALCGALGREDLARRPELATYPARLQRSDEVNAAVAEALREASRDHWIAVLQEAGVPVAPVLHPHEVPVDPQVSWLGLVDEKTHAVGLPIRGIGRAALGAAPDLGQHTETLREHGWSAL